MYGTSLLPPHCRRGHFRLFDNIQQRNLHFLSKKCILFFRGTPARLTHISLTCWRPDRTELRFVNCGQKWLDKVPAALWIARPENWRGNWSPQNFQSPSLQTHASNEFYCVRRKSVKLFWMKSFKFEWLILWKSTNANCHMILYILALKETSWMKNKEHCPYPTTTIPLWEKEMSQKILKSNSTRGAISTENFD